MRLSYKTYFNNVFVTKNIKELIFKYTNDNSLKYLVDFGNAKYFGMLSYKQDMLVLYNDEETIDPIYIPRLLAGEDNILENKIIPAYYNTDEHGISKEWMSLMKNSISSNAGRYSTARMVIDYFEKLYKPLCDLTNNYYISSKNLINHMADYIIDKNKISMVKNLTNIKEKIIPVIFAKIDNCITDKMLYDNWSNNTYFKLLNDMNTEGYAQYAENNIPNISKILNNLLLGMVSYKLINRIYSSNQKGFVTKISILIFSNESKKKTLFETIRNYLNNINKNLKNLAELKETIEKHYSWKYEFYRNISLIDKTVNSIQKGLLNEFKKAPTKDDLDKLNNIYRENDFHRKYIMKDSLVFKHENIVQGNYRSEIDKVFKNVSEKFNELGVLFEKKWQNNIKDETICEYFDIIKQTEEDEKKKATIVDEKLQKDLQILANYHCKYKDYSEINKIRDEIMYYINFIKIKSILNEMKSYCDSKKTPTNNEYKIKLQNAEMVLRPDTCSDIDNLMDSLVFEKMKGYQISNNPLKTIT